MEVIASKSLRAGNIEAIHAYTEHLLNAEIQRQDGNLTFIASEWAMMNPVRRALSSVFAEKYFEGTPSNESLDRLIDDGLVSRDLVRLKKPGWYSPGAACTTTFRGCVSRRCWTCLAAVRYRSITSTIVCCREVRRTRLFFLR